MEFRETGLPDNKLIKDAFDRVHEIYHGTAAPAYVDNAMMEENQMYAFRSAYLEKLEMDGHLRPDQHAEAKKQLDAEYDKTKADVTKEVTKVMDEQIGIRVDIAKELLQSNNPSPELAAVGFLMSTAPDREMDALEPKFGPGVISLWREFESLDSGMADLATASPDAQRVTLAKLTTLFNNAAQEVRSVLKQNNIEEGQATIPLESILQDDPRMVFESQIKTVWSNDEKLSMRCMDAFNALCAVCSAPYKVTLDEQNQPSFTKIKKIGGRRNRPGADLEG